ncbi:hypothetical protein BKA64DRAFT_136390 [Cadophora sp. MPI-SDFR-AT-0126]|nr:hypothetical protein BKA64DRAFT_136390 [Leotiomycetes sp. MPI-SDFR-AT-0126]
MKGAGVKLEPFDTRDICPHLFEMRARASPGLESLVMTWPRFDLPEGKANKAAGKGISRLLCMLCAAPCFGRFDIFVTWTIDITNHIKNRDIGHIVSVSCTVLGTCAIFVLHAVLRIPPLLALFVRCNAWNIVAEPPFLSCPVPLQSQKPTHSPPLRVQGRNDQFSEIRQAKSITPVVPQRPLPRAYGSSRPLQLKHRH